MIFCVEDEQNICELEVYTLQSVGMEAQGCGSGRELFALLEKQVPELIVLDIMLPDEDGVSILRRLLRSKAWTAVPMIILPSPLVCWKWWRASRLCCAAAQHHAPVRTQRKLSVSVSWRSTKWSIR